MVATRKRKLLKTRCTNGFEFMDVLRTGCIKVERNGNDDDDDDDERI